MWLGRIATAHLHHSCGPDLNRLNVGCSSLGGHQEYGAVSDRRERACSLEEADGCHVGLGTSDHFSGYGALFGDLASNRSRRR